jgi:hypothetical protein
MKKLIITLIILISSCVNASTLDLHSGFKVLLPTHSYDEVNTYGLSSLNVIGADILLLSSYDNSRISVYNMTTLNKPVIDILLLSTSNNSIVNFYEGKVNIIDLKDSSKVYLYAAQNLNTISYVETDPFELHIFGKYFSYNSSTNYLRGRFLDDTVFNIYMRSTYPHNNVILHIVPEPATIIFLLVGLAVARITRI